MEGQVTTTGSLHNNDKVLPEGGGSTESFSYHQETTNIEELGRFLKNTQHQLNMASMRSHLLNVDVVTQFDPHRAEKLRQTVQDCHDCIERIKEREMNIKSELLNDQNTTFNKEEKEEINTEKMEQE